MENGVPSSKVFAVACEIWILMTLVTFLILRVIHSHLFHVYLSALFAR